MGWQGQHIKALARERKVTLKSVAEQVGVSRQALNDWTKGQIPKGGHLLRLCKTLGVAPDVFFSSERDVRITVPMHRTRKTAKINESMQNEAKELASAYELFFREASDPGLVQSLRIYKRTESEISKAAISLRKLCGLGNDDPMQFYHVFTLIQNLGVNLIFSTFNEKIKAYAFYTKINNHRVVFVNFKTKILDLIFAVLHESIHSIRDESDAYDDAYIYDEEEERFCDMVASHAQLTDGYFSFVLDALNGLSRDTQLSQLAKFAAKNNHTMHAIQMRIGGGIPEFRDKIYRVETNLRKKSPMVGDYFFNKKDVRGYIDRWKDASPLFLSHLVEQGDKISPRKIGELLSIDSELDAIEAKSELERMKSEG